MPAPTPATPRSGSSTVALVLAWSLVVLPTAWGLEHTVQSALKLFNAPAPAAQTTAPAARP